MGWASFLQPVRKSLAGLDIRHPPTAEKKHDSLYVLSDVTLHVTY